MRRILTPLYPTLAPPMKAPHKGIPYAQNLKGDLLAPLLFMEKFVRFTKFLGHRSAIRSIAFSENGYYLATSADDGEVKLWDLRKLKNFKTILANEKQEPVRYFLFSKRIVGARHLLRSIRKLFGNRRLGRANLGGEELDDGREIRRAQSARHRRALWNRREVRCLV